jgi:hypothetical protein
VEAICIVIGVIAPILAVAAILEAFELLAAWRRRNKFQALREVIRTDSAMLGECLKLSIEHFKAVNRLRDCGRR